MAKIVKLVLMLVLPSLFAASSAVESTLSPIEQAEKQKFCEMPIFSMGRAAYCSMWRSRCGLPPMAETRDEMVERLYREQSPMFGYLRIGDVAVLVDEAARTNADDADSFARRMIDACKIGFDEMIKSRHENSIIR
jgi:hypothetical protein